RSHSFAKPQLCEATALRSHSFAKPQLCEATALRHWGFASSAASHPIIFRRAKREQARQQTPRTPVEHHFTLFVPLHFIRI
ncbi:MAG: hypothetical protein U9N87_09290, partial [Planctomycetota bacterium]|nr:hypothetical protein [Planctomycetota bacterium]